MTRKKKTKTMLTLGLARRTEELSLCLGPRLRNLQDDARMDPQDDGQDDKRGFSCKKKKI